MKIADGFYMVADGKMMFDQPVAMPGAVLLALSMADTELLSIGLVNDIYMEQVNDGYRYCELGV